MTQSLFPHRAWLGLGGNIGDPVASMAQALRRFDQRSDTRVVAVSPVYRTPPWGKTDQDWFHNACAEVETSLSPLQLLDAGLAIERDMKRVRLERWGPRIIDIDVLAMVNADNAPIMVDDERLTLPHPRMQLRAFVLVPLAKIAPTLRIHGKPVSEWLLECDLSEIETARDEADWWKTASGPDEG